MMTSTAERSTSPSSARDFEAFRYIDLGDSLIQQELPNLVERQRLIIDEPHECAGPLTESRIWHRHDRHCRDARMLKQQSFDLGDRNVLAAANDDVFASTGDTDIPVIVHPSQVTGIEPPIA